jgi:hypothetical protein
MASIERGQRRRAHVIAWGHRIARQIDWTRLIDRAFQLCLCVSALVVVFRSFSFRTARLFNAGMPDQTLQEDGAHRWAAWTVLLGLLALTLTLVLASEKRRGWTGVGIAAGIAGSLVLAAKIAGSYWFHVRNELHEERSYDLTIAPGLPDVTIAAVLGSILAISFVAWLIWSQLRSGPNDAWT